LGDIRRVVVVPKVGIYEGTSIQQERTVVPKVKIDVKRQRELRNQQVAIIPILRRNSLI